jgi:hypothetical protein
MRRFCLVLIVLAAPATAADNTPPEGFVALFNGKDLDGWKGHIDMKERATVTGSALEQLQAARNALKDETWSVKDGVIHHVPKVVEVKGKPQKRGCSLQTVKDYGDFELLIDWKIEEQGDSGIYLRGMPQVQIWDSDNAAGAKGVDKNSGSGGLWNNPLAAGTDPKSIGKVPLKKADKAPGEWNTFRIVMKGDNVTIHLNGELVVDSKPLAPFKSFGYDKLPATGPIELQYHGDKLWFKNIYIRELK